MHSPLSRALAPPARIDPIRRALARATLAEFDALVEHGLRDTLAVPGYEHIDPAQIRPNTRRAMRAIHDSLDTADYDHFSGILADVAHQRARQGLPPSALFDLLARTEEMFGQLALRHLPDLADHTCVAVLMRRIIDAARDLINGAFEQAHAEARAEVERLARQFSAPILPALPGVLVLPIVGAVPPARARELVDALLRGIARHAAHTVVVDLTGVVDSDPRLAADLQRASAAARLLGARMTVVGVSPTIALQLAAAGPGLHVHATLAAALQAAAREYKR